jgi:hypothetical protein
VVSDANEDEVGRYPPVSMSPTEGLRRLERDFSYLRENESPR